MAHSSAVYDFVVAVIRALPVDDGMIQRASNAPLRIWRRVLGFEGCAPQLDARVRASGHARALPEPVRQALREATAAALLHGIRAHRQVAEAAGLAARHGVRLLALKGAAQLVGGRMPGARSISDIDLMVPVSDGARFHRLLISELGYSASGRSYAHHLPVLERAGNLSVDLHLRLSDAPVALDSAIWSDTRTASAGASSVELPSATNMVLHALEHGLALNWMGRYRLRDILDLETLYTTDVQTDAVKAYVAQSLDRRACETLLSAAHDLEPRVPLFRGGAWRRIRRVSRARLALAVLPDDPRVAERLFRYAGLAAEASPRSIVRAGGAIVRRFGSGTRG
jgi:hypothetical protein